MGAALQQQLGVPSASARLLASFAVVAWVESAHTLQKKSFLETSDIAWPSDGALANVLDMVRDVLHKHSPSQLLLETGHLLGSLRV